MGVFAYELINYVSEFVTLVGLCTVARATNLVIQFHFLYICIGLLLLLLLVAAAVFSFTFLSVSSSFSFHLTRK